MNIPIIAEPISISEIKALAEMTYGDMLKGVVDIVRDRCALGGEWHIDANNVLLADGSRQEDLWGFNIYPDRHGDEALEYVSLINVRPAHGNAAMEISDTNLRSTMRNIIERLAPDLFS